MRTASRTSFIETGPFDVRIILTEEPRGIDAILDDKKKFGDLVRVTGGTVTALVKGATYKGGHPEIAAVDNWHALISKRDSELEPPMVYYYHTGTDGGTAPTLS